MTRAMVDRLRRFLFAALAAGALAAAPAGATTFGADLSLPANGTRTCAQGLFPDPFMASVLGVSFPSCTWWSAGSMTPGVGDALVPRGGGVLRRVRVKVGPVTGRMQVLVLRQRRQLNVGTAACCFYVASTPVFTPAANGVTEIETNIPVRNDLDPASGVENFDLIALSSLDPGVPVPSWLGGSGYDGGAIGGVFPHWEPGTEQRPDYGVVTAGQVLINGDVDPVPTTTGLPPRGGTTTPEGTQGPQRDPAGPPPVALDATRAPRVRSGGRRAELPLRCALDRRCRGTVRLESRAGGGTGARAYGRARFSIPAGATRPVTVSLGDPARATLRRGRDLVAYANVTVEGRRYAGARVTLGR